MTSKKAKALPPAWNALFEACFRIQREACEAAGRHIPLIVENVRGAQKWVGRARWNYGSFYLWGDVPALMPVTFKGVKVASDAGRRNTTSGRGQKPDGRKQRGSGAAWVGDAINQRRGEGQDTKYCIKQPDIHLTANG